MIDVETEEVSAGEQTSSVRAGMRVNIYARELEQEYNDGETVPMRVSLTMGSGYASRRNCDFRGTFDFGENVSPYLWKRGISHLDVVAITHGHSDHIGGIHAVLNNFRPHELWVGALPDTPAIHELLEYAGDLGVRVMKRSEGEPFDFGGVQVAALSPPTNWHTVSQEQRFSRNANQLPANRVCSWKGMRSGQSNSAWPSEDLKSDLLKVGHHGSATSSTTDFIHAVKPHWAIISVGTGNAFGHPRQETLEHLQRQGVLTYRTDQNCAVTFYLDGKSVSPPLACLR